MLQVQHIPLSKLTASSDNVRRTGRFEGIKGLAASIKAHGLLQNLTVRKGTGEAKGFFEVVAGGRRLAALQRLAKKKQLAASTRIACHVLDGENTVEISLAENEGQCPMHPADQYEAFAKLHRDHNMPAADIAARFGVTEAVVKQRLKLGAISPKLINAYRSGKITLDALTAFAITDDHKAQERVWRALPEFSRSRHAILQALTEDKVPAHDRRARFVGEDAYTAAGGTIVRDLFDAAGSGYFADAGLLNTLARAKLDRHASKVIHEGWKWVSVSLAFDHEAASTMRRLHPVLNAEDQAALDALHERENAFYESDDEGADLAADLAAVESEIAALEAREAFQPDDIARGGAFISLDHDGTPLIARGYLRKEDAAEAEAAASEDEDAKPALPPGNAIPEKLARELTAARTSALRCELAKNSGMALVALTHALALHLFYDDTAQGFLELRMRAIPLTPYDPSLGESASERAMAEAREAWRKRLPDDAARLWDAIRLLPEADRLALLAYCTAQSLNAVHDGKDCRHTSDALATNLGLDMTKYWQPSAANYLGRISKERIRAILREAVSPEAADNLFDLPKQAMAEAAAQRLAGKGWLPPLLRAV